MKQTVPGKFYTWFNDETWEEALANHNIDGFDDIQWALFESCDNTKKIPFKIVDHNKNVVLDSSKFDWEQLEIRANCRSNKFYSKFENETLKEAVNKHSEGFKSIEEAIDDANHQSGKPGESYEIYNHELVVVHKGKV